MWNTPKHDAHGRVIDSIAPTPAERHEKKPAETPAGKRTVRRPLYEEKEYEPTTHDDFNSIMDSAPPTKEQDVSNMQADGDSSYRNFAMDSSNLLSGIHSEPNSVIAKAAEPPTIDNNSSILNDSIQNLEFKLVF